MSNLIIDEKSLIKQDLEIKKHIITMVYKAKSGHIGGSLSCSRIILSLYQHILEQGDHFILSKGHAAPALYAVLHLLGRITQLSSFRQFGSLLQGHPKKNKTLGIELSTGSLGFGASTAVGMALGDQLHRTYALLGDGECEEGIIWEAAMSAKKFKLINLTFIIDRNGMQLDGPTDEVMNIEPFRAKWEAFGWYVLEVYNTSFGEIIRTLQYAKTVIAKPVVVIVNTVKGDGVSFMQNGFHGRVPTEKEYNKAMEELEFARSVL